MKGKRLKKGKNVKISTSSTQEQVDRISDLPESLLHHIFSFMDMREIVQTCLLSKTWITVWKSLPVLNFGYCFWNSTSLRKHHNVLHKRDTSSAILKINLSRNYCCHSPQFDTILAFALTKPIKEIYLETPKRQPRIMPDILFNSTIEVFKLESVLYRRPGVPVELPVSLCRASKLKTLELISAKLPKGNSAGELAFNYPDLENLMIDQCDCQHIKILNVNAPKLKNLVVGNYENTSSCVTKFLVRISYQ
ncbi:hypothetical protein AQUCO_01600035v1 [Aquilegia coerulea]|uniref:F-box domain-containing protein n=1 Tax=Aquilegia coerulea TaxID=218851 RepID=A0A2G5DQM3_AQUCA|nr:hypothetical protein AQUCO_01600035v1 [Aquilegia coerulea]